MVIQETNGRPENENAGLRCRREEEGRTETDKTILVYTRVDLFWGETVSEERVKEDQQIEARRKEVRDRQLYTKGKLIARHLGERQAKNHGANWLYKHGGLIMIWDDYAPNLSVSFKKQRVLSIGLGVTTAYRPDIEGWIELIDRLYEGLKPSLDARVQELEKERLEQFHEDWGP